MRNAAEAGLQWWRARRLNAMPAETSIREQYQGTAARSASGRCCIFASYDPQGRVDPYVIHYLQALRELDADILFITTSPALSTDDLAAIAPLCRLIVRRENVSADFGSWSLGIQLLGARVRDHDQLILANDSVYGPFHDLLPIFHTMAEHGSDLWGLTACAEIADHLQSYFLVLQTGALASPFFADYWGGFRHEWRKRRLITEYEVGMSVRARQSGLTLQSWIPSQALGGGRNTTLFDWAELITGFGFPFLKCEILRRNRFRSRDARHWRHIVESASRYNCDLIANHLRRVGSAVPFDETAPRS